MGTKHLLCALAAAAGLTAADVKHFANWEYRAIGPANMGGRTTDVEGVPGNPAVVYAGTGGGGLWKTTNGGVTWTALWEREGTYSVGDLALDPRNPDVIWLGSGEANMRNSVSFGDGVYKSTDGGKTWKHLGLKETEHIARVAVSPLDSNTAWVCAIGHQAAPNEERGVFVTHDGGATWKKTLYLDDKHGCADLDVDPKNPNVVYAAMWRFERKPWNHTSGSEQSGIYKSVDGGATWKRLENGLPKLMGRAGVKVAPSNTNAVYVACESKEGTLYRSSNAGESFELITREREVVSRGFYYADIRVDPQDENRVYAIATSLQVSIDGGKTWRRIATRVHSDHHSLWIDPLNPNRIWDGNDGGLAVSYDRGENWEPVLNIPLGQFYQIHADNAQPFYNITGGLQDNGTWRGPSRVRQPSGITNSEWTLVSFGDGFYAYSHPDNPNLLLTESQGGALYMLNLETGEQTGVSPQPRSGRVSDLKYRFNWNTPIHGSQHGKSTVYYGSNVLFQSRDFGRSWEPVSPDLTTNNREKLRPAGGPVWLDNSTAENHCTIISIGESPVKGEVLWAGTDDGNVQVTSNGGKSWTNVAANIAGAPKEAPVSHVEPSRTSAETAYVSFDAHLLDDYRPYIFKTTDAGKTWTSISGDLPAKAYVHIIREDRRNPNLLYAGTELGLFVSFDGGGRWQPLLLKNLSKVAVHDIIVHPRENDLILGTHGRSIMILDDIAPLQQMTAEIAAKRSQLFDIRAALRYATPMRAYGMGNKAYAGPNPPYGALISYYLKDKLDEKAALSLEVLDSAGKVIRKLDGLKRDAGVNRVAWDLRSEGPAARRPPTPQEMEFAGGGPRGPLVLPGTYTVRLTVDGEKSEKPVEVRMDGAIKTPPSDLAALRDLSLKVQEMVDGANRALKKMDGLREQLGANEKFANERLPSKKAEVAKLVAGYQKELDAVALELGMKPGGSRLEEAPKLAEDLSGLLQGLSNLHAAPTQAQQNLYVELRPRYEKLMPQAEQLLKRVAEWSEALRKLGAPGVAAGE
jgi:photosystem II stability/assembly factor-like uncharacterized protein